MFPIFLSLFLGSVMVSAGDAPSGQEAPSKTYESQAEAAEPNGIATVVEIKGRVTAISSSGKERELKEGDAIYLNETVSTRADSSLQMEIADESLFTLSENTTLRMDLFDLDEEKKDGHLTANVAKGIFRFVSGQVAKVKPENVNIEVPAGTIGIRGTIVLGEIEGEKCLVSLEAEEGDKVQHRIVFSGMAGGRKQEVEITKPGFATMIEARGMAPKPVFELPQEKREKFQQRLPQPKFLPRDAQGRPAMNPNVRDPRKFPGPMNRDRDSQKNPGGPNPPSGPHGFNQAGGQNFNRPKPQDGFMPRNPEAKPGFNKPQHQEKPHENFQKFANPKPMQERPRQQLGSRPKQNGQQAQPKNPPKGENNGRR